MTEAEARSKVATWLNSYKGIKEGSSQHKELVNIFNNSGLCTRYKMTTSDAWCAMAVSDAFIATDMTSIFPCVECYCPSMISMAQSAGIWVEDDSYTPKVGDVIMYDWDDSGSGDCTGTADHVGIVQSISGSSFEVIEGNKSDTVGVRSMTVNGRYIRGYITPNYAKVASSDTTTTKNLYRVQAGAFEDLVNANNLVKQLKEAGFESYVFEEDKLYKVQAGAFSVKANAEAQVENLKKAGFEAFIK